MQTPEEVAVMLRLNALGWGVRRIPDELGCSHMTVRRYLAEGGWAAYRGRGRPRTLNGLEGFVTATVWSTDREPSLAMRHAAATAPSTLQSLRLGIFAG